MSHSTPPSSPSRVLEQRNLLGGLDLLPVMGGSGRKRSRQFHVPSERKLGFAAALALVVEHGKEKAKETGTTSMTRCPRCGHVGPTEQDFGFRIMSQGRRRPQSWCRGCRGQHLEPVNASAPRPQDGWLFPPEPTQKPQKAKATKDSKPKAKKRARRSNEDLT